MAKRHPVPRLVLLSDRRNDAVLEAALARLPRGSALVFRHYHLPPAARAQRLRSLRLLARARGLAVVEAGIGYGAPAMLRRGRGLRLATAHSLREIGRAVRAQADAVLLSPVFATRSHPGGPVLGPVRFLLLARQSPLPVIALGGMTAWRARGLPVRGRPVHGWAAIDGLSVTTRIQRFHADS